MSSLPSDDRARAAVAVATAVTAATLLILDLLWLGVIARPLYDSTLGPLLRPTAYWPAAGLFYAMYVGAIVIHAEPGWGWSHTGPTSSPTGRSCATGRARSFSPTWPGAWS